MSSAGQDGVSPKLFAMKLNAMLILVILDCFCNGFADNLWEPSQVTASISLSAMPMALHFLMLLLFFMLLWHTFLLRHGLLLQLWGELRGIIAFSTVRFGILLAARVPRIMAAIRQTSPEAFWADAGNQVAFFAHNLVSVIYNAWLLRRSYSLANVRFYKPQLWQKHHRRQSASPNDSSILA
mmetsp:Transcript_22075/g.39587  ORF Transcript_22075/g.39587 Transcript_22075/m.39587 type:complete len:182 (-) Transcript_22075:99-644(-)